MARPAAVPVAPPLLPPPADFWPQALSARTAIAASAIAPCVVRRGTCHLQVRVVPAAWFSGPPTHPGLPVRGKIAHRPRSATVPRPTRDRTLTLAGGVPR